MNSKRLTLEVIVRFPFFVLAWAVIIAIKIPTVLLGLIVIPILYRYRHIAYVDLPSWSRPWANPEDWQGGPQTFTDSLPRWWVNKQGTSIWSFFKYHAIRNPANGLRSFELLDLDIDRARVRYLTTKYLHHYEPHYMRGLGVKTAAYICWQGWQAGVKVVHLWSDERHFVLKIGWRVGPRDAYQAIDPGGIRVDDSGFATKLILWRKG